MAYPVLNNQWNPVGGLFNVPSNMIERMSSIAIRVSMVAAFSRLGLMLAKMGMNQVCANTCRLEDFDYDTVYEAVRVCNEDWPKGALVDPANPPFGWEVDPSKREIALVNPTHPPLGWKYDTFGECLNTNLGCHPVSQTNFCKSIHSGVHYVEGVVSTISQKVNSIVGNIYFLRPAVQLAAFVLNRIARRI